MYEVQKYIAKSIQDAIKALTPEQSKEVLQRFHDASYGHSEVDDATLALIGVLPHKEKFFKGVKGWNSFCFKVCKAINGVGAEECRLAGTGFRSQFYGRQVIENIRRLRGELVEMAI